MYKIFYDPEIIGSQEIATSFEKVLKEADVTYQILFWTCKNFCPSTDDIWQTVSCFCSILPIREGLRGQMGFATLKALLKKRA